MLNWESLFIPSRLSVRQSMESLTGVNPYGRSTEKVKLLLNGSHLAPQGESHNVIMGMTAWSSSKIALRETSSPPTWCAKMLKWFYDTSTGAATGASRCGSFVEDGFGLLVVSY
jgi:hypothetical protein